MLFGPHGDAISTIIDAARELNAEQAAKLSASRHPEAERAYNRVWDAWLRDRGMPGPDAKDGLDGTLAMSGFRPTSPINSGLTVLYNELLRRAALLSGNAATETDGDDTWLVDPRRGAVNAPSSRLCGTRSGHGRRPFGAVNNIANDTDMRGSRR